MGKTKLKKLGNFLLVTDVNSNFETRFSSIETFYSFEDKDKVLVLTWVTEGFIYKYDVADLLDDSNVAYTKTTLDSFLSTFLGLSNLITIGNTIANPIITALPVGASTSVLQTTTNTKLDTVITNTGASLTDTQLRATPVAISPRPNTTGVNGTFPYKLISSATTNANVVKASPGNLYSIIAIGLTSTVRYLKLYNKASIPTVGTDVPVMTIPVPANTQGAGVALPFSMGVNFSLGIAIAITSGSADNDTGAIGAGDIIVNLTYA